MSRSHWRYRQPLSLSTRKYTRDILNQPLWSCYIRSWARSFKEENAYCLPGWIVVSVRRGGECQGALALARDNSFRPRTKHIHAREWFTAQMVQSGQYTISYVSTRDGCSCSDKGSRHEALTRRMGLQFGVEEQNQCNQCNESFPAHNALLRAR